MLEEARDESRRIEEARRIDSEERLARLTESPLFPEFDPDAALA